MKIGKRTVLAKSCTRCGQFKQAKEFPVVGGGYRDSYCRRCHNLHSRPAMREHQKTTLDNAKKHRQPWSTGELRTFKSLIEEGLSGPAMAHALGRSVYSIYTMKNKVRRGLV